MNPDKSSPDGGTRDLQTQPPGGSSDDATTTTNSPATPEEIKTQQAMAADVIRSQIGNLYDGGGSEIATELAATAQTDTNPYHREHKAHPLPEAEQWKQYHTAWQNYYQKYYENYYTAKAATPPILEVREEAQSSKSPKHEGYFAHQPAEPVHTETAEELSNNEALFELRQKLLGRVHESAKKIRKSRHFIPIISALVVVLIFVFIQYNQVITANVMAYVSPGSIDPQNIVVDPTTDVAVTQDPRLIIPKINVDVPVTYDIGTDNASQMAAMANGLAHFPIAGASSHPGEAGNTVLAGHSSNDLFDTGDYKFIFAQLDKLSVGDSVYANYKGKRYTYVVTKTQVVAPTDVSALVYPTTKPILTLITCTPLGTALNRLLVTAEQVSPDPSAAAAAPAGSGTASNTTVIPGDSGTLFEKLFGK
ncbi:MAG: sortase family protein [Candidatus Saccharibacteria bacterium]|nr:sortase family protein [Candidatus Saccharibacteria bacterium]